MLSRTSDLPPIYMLYFSFGSNMSSKRLQARVPSARALGSARLDQHRLCFHKRNLDGSAKADALFTGEDEDQLHGVLFDIAPEDKSLLDAKEGLGHGYEEKRARVWTADESWQDCFLYYATDIDPTLLPYSWYLEHVLRGAREHALPALWLRFLESIPHCPDPDPARHQRELAIY